MNKGNENWWTFARWSDEYEQGVDEYIKKAFAFKSQGDQIYCPCENCHYRYWHHKNVVKEHIICHGFVPRLDLLSELGMYNERENPITECDKSASMGGDTEGLVVDSGMEDLLNDTLREGLNQDEKKLFKLIDEGQQELYSGCKKMSKLSFTIKLFIFKCDYKLSNVAFSALLELLKDALPDDANLPSSFNEAKKSLKILGLDYTKIDACPNDCMLFWGENANATSCHKCNAPRWKLTEKEQENGKNYRIPLKILRYFPVKEMLRRLFMCKETAKYMTWHASGCEDDGLLHHPADGQAWKDFDKSFPKFAEEPHNVRLGVATDGFNPFHTMSIVHSTWPVILINYNLPPWMIMKQEFLMLTLLIPGPFSPGNNLDIYLQPLMKDLQDLWEYGLETYDASTGKRFNLHATTMTTVSDFPAYAMLSGWSTKGKMACPCCHYDTQSIWLEHSHKYCYWNHRIFLYASHPWRYDTRYFNGEIEERTALIRLKGTEILELLRDFPNEFGKKQKKKPETDIPWRKLPIFFELPYWKDCTNRHNLDVMHIEKNVFDNVIGTLLDIPKKTKDHKSARHA